MLRRFLRVWPAYAVVIVACAAISYVFPARDMPEISRMASVFYLSNLWFAGVDWGFFAARDPFMNQSIWMMRYEVDLYIALALIAMLGRRAMRVVAAVVLVASFGAAETHPGSGGLLECWSLYFGGFFSFGVLLREFPSLRRGRVVLCFVAAGIALLAFGCARPDFCSSSHLPRFGSASNLGQWCAERRASATCRWGSFFGPGPSIR